MKAAGSMRSKLGLGLVLTAVAGAAHALAEPWQLNMSPGVTQTSREVYHIHMLGFYVCCAIGVVVFGAMIIAMFKFRKSKGAVAATWSHSTVAETIWTVVPILILVSLAWPATSVMVKMAYTEKSDMTVKITGYQWKWGYDYINVGDKPYHVRFISRLDTRSDKTRELRSGLDPWAVKDKDYNGAERNTYLLDVDHPLVLPTDTKIRFVVTGDDVIHAWWVPQLGWKQDAIPGIINDDWTEIHDPGHLSRPVRRVVWPGPRLHADRGQGRAEGRIHEMAGRAGSPGHQGQRARGSGRRSGRDASPLILHTEKQIF